MILLVKGTDLYIGVEINYTLGSGFFMAVVNGNTNIDPSVGRSLPYDLQGCFFSDSAFKTREGK